MTYLEPEIKELGRSADNNTLNTRSLIRTLKYVPDINADGSFHGERVWTVNTHTPTHPPTHTHTHTHTHRLEAQFIKKVRQHWGWAEDKALFIKETCSSCFAYVHFQSQLTAKYFLLGKSETWGKFLSTRLLRKCNKKSLIKITASQNCSNGLVWRGPCISYTPALQPHQIVSLRR